MSVKKKILKSPVVQYLLSWFLAGYIWLVFLTNKKIKHIHPDAMPYMQGKDNAIFAFWHGRMMLLPAFCPPHHKMHVLISLHRDGKLISQVIGHFGQKTVSGSTSKGGKEAVSEILKLLETGANISITPDGPRGPVHGAARGIAGVARFSGKVVLPVVFSATRAKHLKSWDKFMLALPFGKIFFYVGKPIMVSEDGDEEDARLHIERSMNALLAEADARAAA